MDYLLDLVYNRWKHLPEGKGQLLFLWLHQVSYCKSRTAQEASLQNEAEWKKIPIVEIFEILIVTFLVFKSFLGT